MEVQVGNCMRDVNVALIAVTPFESWDTTVLAKDI